MSKRTIHPSPEELSAFSLGQLPPHDAVAVESHISECQPCCDTLLGLASDDTFVGLLKDAEQLPPDRTVDHDLSAPHSTSTRDVPAPLVEHPRYEILRLIGKGGMGDVHEAIHRKMERRVALKVINRDLFQNAEAVNRFHREVKTAAQLSHPNIVTSHDADQAGDFHFMVMEFVDGVDLSRIVKDKGALPVADACNYIRQAAMGLHHAHECGMVHRDIKPHNLMLTSDGAVKILDFGLASFAPEVLADADTIEAKGDLTSAGSIMGTPDFISPEQANDAREADIRSDIYSLGMTLYFLLSGRPPFPEGSVMHKLKAHAQTDAEPLESVREDIPAELALVVAKMTAKNPDNRFQTPLEVAAALEPFVQPPQPEQVHSPRLKVQPPRSRVSLLTAVATLFVAAIVAAVVFYIQTDNGVVRVEVTDPLLKVAIRGQIITIDESNNEPITIRAGEQTLVVRMGNSDFEFETDKFEVRRNGNIAFKVDLLEGRVVVSKDGKRFYGAKLPESDLSGKAKGSYMLAKRLEQNGDFVKAADAYLQAYRGDPTLLAYEQLAAIKKAKRTREFVEVFHPDRLLQVALTGNPVERIAKDLMADEATRLDGRALLHRMWEARPSSQWPLLGNPPKGTVFQIAEPLLEARKKPFTGEKHPPTDPGWKRFEPNNSFEAKGEYTGLLQELSPKLKDTVEQKIYLARAVREVEETVEEDPRWKAGVAVLAFLEAELGNDQRAIQLIQATLTDAESPITCLAASTLGQALEGKTAALDQIVIRLYEKSVVEWGDFDLGAPYYTLSYSPIQNLAGLYGKYGRREEARRLLLRLTVPEGVGVSGSGNKFVACPDGRVLIDYSDSGPTRHPKVLNEDQAPNVNCMACHRKERNLWSYLTMSNKLTDVGYPVDARLSLARIDASFGSSFTSDAEWAKTRTPKLNRAYYVGYFRPVAEKVEKAITPQAVQEALESGAFNDVGVVLKNPVIAENATNIDLMLSVRGVNGKSTLFSPVVDLLELATKTRGDEAAIANVKIDQLLAEAFDTNPDNVEAGIAGTVFAFLRNDLEDAARRLEKLEAVVDGKEAQETDLSLWLVARLALAGESTNAIGEKLADRALTAAGKQSDPLWKEAILAEWKRRSGSLRKKAQ